MKITKKQWLMDEAREAKELVLEAKPANEWELIQEMQKHFTGISKHQKKNGNFAVTGEIIEYPEKMEMSRGGIKEIYVGFISFTVPSCKKAFERSPGGKIINHEQFKTINF